MSWVLNFKGQAHVRQRLLCTGCVHVSTTELAFLLRSECVTTSTGAWVTWKRTFSCCATTRRRTTWRALRWSHMVHSRLLLFGCRGAALKPRAVFCLHTYFSILSRLSWWQIYEDSIVIKSVFESARQRIVTNEEQKEAVSVGGSLNDNGGGAEDQFVASAGK